MTGYKVLCPCGWHGMSSEVLKAQSPFDRWDDITGCPRCKSVNTIVTACDEPGCWAEVDCGTPTATGYRNTCGKHKPKEEPPR